jgi:hypothetical protein
MKVIDDRRRMPSTALCGVIYDAMYRSDEKTGQKRHGFHGWHGFLTWVASRILFSFGIRVYSRRFPKNRLLAAGRGKC